MAFELMDTVNQNAVIKVIGVGGGGGNAVQHMVEAEIEGVEFICANTDAQALKMSLARTTLQLGKNITKGLGAGADPEIGRQAALEDRDQIADVLDGSDMVFITGGMGGLGESISVKMHDRRRAGCQGSGHPHRGGRNQTVLNGRTPAW